MAHLQVACTLHAVKRQQCVGGVHLSLILVLLLLGLALIGLLTSFNSLHGCRSLLELLLALVQQLLPVPVQAQRLQSWHGQLQ